MFNMFNDIRTVKGVRVSKGKPCPKTILRTKQGKWSICPICSKGAVKYASCTGNVHYVQWYLNH
eukprot:3108418-Amphidinium_carterae.1